MINSNITKSNRLLVVTPTLGDSPYLDATVRSVMTLGLDIVHVLSVPAAKCELLQRRYPHAVVVADRGKNMGLYGALNAAFDHAPKEWDWFTYINDDDCLLLGYAVAFKKHISSARPEAVMYGAVDLIDEEERVLSRIAVEGTPAWFPAVLSLGISPLSQQGNTFSRKVVRKIGYFNPELRLCGDFDFWLRAYAQGFAFKYYNIPVGQFRLRKGQLSSDTRQTLQEQEEILRKHLPLRCSPFLALIAKWRFRMLNLPKYLGRMKTHGLRSSYTVLAEGVAK